METYGRLEQKTQVYIDNVCRRVRQDWRSRWSAMPPGPAAKRHRAVAARGRQAETGRRADPVCRGEIFFAPTNRETPRFISCLITMENADPVTRIR